MRTQSIAIVALLLASCGGGGKEGSPLERQRAELAELKKQQSVMTTRIAELERQIAAADPGSAVEKAKLVDVSSVQRRDFDHYIDLQGRISTDATYYVSPRGMGGQVKAVYVRQGEPVRKGQLLLRLDDALPRQNMRQVESQLAFARDLYRRQQSLWNEGIGTEVQLLGARNNVESLEKQLALVKEQASMSEVYAEVSGIAETVNIRVGEFFTGSPMAGITIIDPSVLKAVVDVPENYAPRVGKGMTVSVEVPDLGKRFDTRISLVGESINANSRSFTAECRMPSGGGLKPNQLAVVRILDHSSKNAVVVPVQTVQADEKGKFVFVMREEGGRRLARKVPVTIGQFYGDEIEVLSGLTGGEGLITRGFQGLYDGQPVEAAK
jgi:membrane fusion protein (multidrug efflux system)